MTQLISPGGASFTSKPFYTTSPIVITALGLGAGKATLQLITVVDTTQPNNGTPCNPKADVSNLDVTSRTDYPCFKLCAASPVGAVPIGGWYIASLTPNTTLATASVTYEQVSIEQANAVPKCNGCEDVVPPPTPVTQSITPCPITFPMVWDYNGATYATLGAFVNAYKAAMFPVAVTFIAPCTFSAPAGTAFLPTALSATNKLALSPCPTFPAQWSGQVYATVTAFATGVASQGAGWSYDIATCTINAPQGVAIPPAPTAAPTAPITGVACPIVYPVVYPATTGATYANQAAFDAAIEAQLGVSVTVSSTTPCQVVQTSGAVGLLPASIVVSAPVVVPPCYLTLGAQHANNAGGRIYTLVDCPPSKRASYVSAGWVQLNDNAGNYETLLSPTAQVVCGIDFTEPYLNNAGAVIGFTPY